MMRFILLLLVGLVFAANSFAADVGLMTLPTKAGVFNLRVSGGGAYFDGQNGVTYQVVANGGALTLIQASPPAPTARRPHMLPDGVVTLGEKNIRGAWLTGPTRRYGHGVLGDAIEASGLAVETATGAIHTFALPNDSVFEDRFARLADADGDGGDEVVVVRSYLNRGAAVAVFGVVNGALRHLGESPAIGMAHRWLNPVGVADFDGDGRAEIAVVITPHIGGVLTFYRLVGSRLQMVGEALGFSNHQMGSRALGMSVLADLNGDGVTDLALPDSRRRAVRGVTFNGGLLTQLFAQPHASPVVTDMVRADLNGDGDYQIIYGLADGTLVALHPLP